MKNLAYTISQSDLPVCLAISVYLLISIIKNKFV